jgi:predicted Zn-dependent protease
MVLTALTGSPLGSALVVLLVWVVADRFTLGVLPDPLRWTARLRREWQLQRVLAHNPHDRRTRLELAQLLVERRAFAPALGVLKPNLEQGDADVQTLFTMGWACVGAGYPTQGEQLLERAAELEPGFRVGEIDRVLGQGRLARGDFPGARLALERLVRARQGTVQGRVLLARALAGSGDDAGAALMRDEAWAEYTSAPGFQRRQERWWAWRARPSRPLLYLALLAVGLSVCGAVVRPALSRRAQPSQYER